MNKLTKALLLVLSIVLVLAGLTVMAFAAEDTTEYLYGGFTVKTSDNPVGTSYAPTNEDNGTPTLLGAVSGAAANTTIVLDNNINLNEAGYLTPAADNVTLDLNGKTVSGATRFLDVKGGLKVTVLGPGVINATGILFSDNDQGGTITFKAEGNDRIKFNSTRQTSDANSALRAGSAANVTLQNVDFTVAVALTDNTHGLFHINNSTFNMINSTVRSSGTTASSTGYVIRSLGSSNVTLDGVVFDDSIINSSYRGVQRANTSVVTIKNSYISAAVAIRVDGGGGAINIYDSTIKGNGNYALWLSGPVSIYGSYVTSSKDAVYSDADAAKIFVKDSVVESNEDTFEFSKTGGVTVDSSVIRSGMSGNVGANAFYYSNSTPNPILLGKDGDILKVTNSTVVVGGYNYSNNGTQVASHLVLFRDPYKTNSHLTGKVTIDNCNISFAHRLIGTNLDTTNTDFSITINDTRIQSVNDGEVHGYVRGGAIVNITGDTKFIMFNRSPSNGAGMSGNGATPKFTVCEGVRLDRKLDFVTQGNAKYAIPDGYELVYDPFGDAEAPYVVAPAGTAGSAVGAVNYDFSSTSTKLGNTTGTIVGTVLTDGNTGYHLAYKEGDSHTSGLTVSQANTNIFIKYTLPTQSYTNGSSAGVLEGDTYTFTSDPDFVSFGGGAVATTAIEDVTIDTTTYTANKVVIAEMDFSAASIDGYIKLAISLSSRGNAASATSSGGGTGSTNTGSALFTIQPGVNGANATITDNEGNVLLTLRDNLDWNKLYVVVDSAADKYHVYVNGTRITPEAGADINANAQYINGIRMDIVNNYKNDKDAAFAVDNFNFRTYKNYASGSAFNLNDYLTSDTSYLTLPASAEVVSVGGRFYGSVNAALEAANKADTNAVLHSDVSELQYITKPGALYTVGYAFSVVDDAENKFINYTVNDYNYGAIYNFVYNTDLGAKFNLSLYTSFDINFFLPIELKDYLVSAEVNGADVTGVLREYTDTLGATFYKASCGRASDEANDSVAFVLVFTQYGDTFTYTYKMSIADYTKAVLANCDTTAPTEQQTLMAYILAYANEANLYFPTLDGGAADTSLSELAGTWKEIKDTSLEDVALNPVNTLNTSIFYGAAVNLGTAPSIKLVLQEGLEPAPETIAVTYVDVKTGEEVNARVTVSGNDVVVSGISIYNFAQTINVFVDGKCEGQYNIADYRATIEKGAAYEALVKALCEYISYAKAIYAIAE